MRVWYRSYPGAQACAGTVDGEPWLLGGHTLVADLREMDHVCQDAYKKDHVNAAAVFALALADSRGTVDMMQQATARGVPVFLGTLP